MHLHEDKVTHTYQEKEMNRSAEKHMSFCEKTV